MERERRQAQMTKSLSKHQEWVIEACEYAESCLNIFRAQFPEDDRPEMAVAMTRRWIVGSANKEKLLTAYDDAYDAFEEASALALKCVQADRDRYTAAFHAARCALRALQATLDPGLAAASVREAAIEASLALEFGEGRTGR